MITVHYGKKGIDEIIEMIDTAENIIDFFSKLVSEQENIVYVSTFEPFPNTVEQIYIDEDLENIFMHIQEMANLEDEQKATTLASLRDENIQHMIDDLPSTYFIQEYDSYQEAYYVALSMREPNPLCYSKV